MNPVISMVIEPELANVPTVRRTVTGTLPALPDELRERLELVVTELVTNAIEASSPDVPVAVAVVADGATVELEVRNRSAAAVPEPPDRVAASAVRGRGLMIVEHLADDFTVDDGGDEVVARAALRPR